MLGVLTGLSGILILVLLTHSDYATGVNLAPPQPVPFSHRHHVKEVGLDCRYCHDQVEREPTAGMPATSVCMTCHSQLFTDSPLLAPVRASLETGKPLRWSRVTRVPPYVYFDHSVHLAKGVGCAECHGQVADMAMTRQVMPMTMGWCLHCHENPGPRLRPREQLFDTLTPPLRNSRQFLQQYHVQTDALTDCTVCHR